MNYEASEPSQKSVSPVNSKNIQTESLSFELTRHRRWVYRPLNKILNNKQNAVSKAKIRERVEGLKQIPDSLHNIHDEFSNLMRIFLRLQVAHKPSTPGVTLNKAQ